MTEALQGLGGIRLGVLGGMGPLASAEFLRTIYRLHRGEKEQSAPQVLLYSNPHVPDRTATLLEDRGVDHLLDELVRGVELLFDGGCERVVVCCFTIHHLLDRLPPRLRSRVVSLIDVAVEAAAQTQGSLLMACTVGTRRLRVFERHPVWSRLASRAVYPGDADLDGLHDAIYRIKRGRPRAELAHVVVSLAGKYGTERVIAGCTELHLVSTLLEGQGSPVDLIDPLTLIATRITEDSSARTIHS